MYKFTCEVQGCRSQGIVNYIPQPSELVKCGGCGLFSAPIKMSESEYAQVFDYDPFAEIPLP